MKKNKVFEVVKDIFAVLGVIFLIYHVALEIFSRVYGSDLEVLDNCCDDDSDSIPNDDFFEEEGLYDSGNF